MHLLRRLLVLAALLDLAACSDPEPVQGCVPSQPLGLMQSTGTSLYVVGAPASVWVSGSPGPVCGGSPDAGQVLPESATAEVYGPDNLHLPVTVVMLRSSASARIEFTPVEEGIHHVIVAFAPVGGLRQFDVYVAADRQQEPVLAELPVPGCNHLDRTSRGTWLCDGLALRGPSLEEQSLGTGVKVAVAGDVVWAMEPERIRRFADTEAGLELTATHPLDPGMTDVRAWLATGDELVVAAGWKLHRVTFSERTGLAAHPPAPLPFPLNSYDIPRELLVRAGERVLWASMGRLERGPYYTRVCPYQRGPNEGLTPVPPSDPFAADACQYAEGMPVSAEDGVLWTAQYHQVGVGTLRRWGVRNGALVEQGSLRLEGALLPRSLPTWPGPAAPLLGFGGFAPFAVATWNPDKGTVRLERFADLDFESTRVSSRFYWGRQQAGAGPLRVYAR